MKQILAIVMMSLLFGCGRESDEPLPELGSRAWLEQVERVVDTTDGAGGGPDVGSEEWMRVVSHKLRIYDDHGHGPDLGGDEWQRAVHFKAFHVRPDN